MTADSGSQITIWSIVSLLAGTIVSSIVAYLLQRGSFAEARRIKAQDKFEERKTMGLTLYHKMIRIASTLSILQTHFDEAFARAEAMKVKGQAWQIVVPIAHLAGQVKFKPEELTFLMLLDKDLFNDMGPFDDIHNTALDMFELYQIRRQALTDTLSAEMQGSLGSTTLTRDELARLAPKMAELNMLIDGMKQRVKQDSDEAWKLLANLQSSLNREFILNLRLERKPPSSTLPAL
jgi:hypothetical protein